MRATVNQEFCESAGVCRGLVPDVFVLAGDGTTQAVAADVPLELEEDVTLAIDSCPRLAISLLS
ncbi:ferredoxin [Longivirga aurantiaca]|uniref:Ferredoxin n=1 Tax=Longivirga aurantiaca TaxID=1837743 RepID=A0ABW1T3G4_9ACTN